MNHAHKGRRKEHQVREVFEKLKYLVTRSAGSKGLFDLIAVPLSCVHKLFHCAACKLRTEVEAELSWQVVFIQVKPRTIWAGEIEELRRFARKMPGGCRVEGWVVEDRKPPRRQFQF